MLQLKSKLKISWSYSICILVAAVLLLQVACTRDPQSKTPHDRKLRVIAIFATPIEEPWDKAIHDALLKAQLNLSIDYKWTDNVSQNEFEKTLRQYAEERNDLIVGDAFASEEIVRRVARDYPGIAFCFGSGLGPVAPNFSVFDNWIHEPAYLAGLIAGKLTKSNIIGIVGGFPIPEVNRIANAFILGAKEANPNVKFKVAFIGSWFDPPKAKNATHVILSQGADVIYAERAGVIEACDEAKIPVIGNLTDQSRASEMVVTSVVWDMWPTVNHVIELVRSGKFTAENYAEWSMMSKGGARLAQFAAWERRLNKNIIDMVNKRADEIITGRFRVPIDEFEPKSQ